jgi:Cu-Zn family superoxide dismutase
MSWLKLLVVGLSISALTSSSALAAQATAEMKSTDGEILGTVTLTETPHGVLLFADFKRIPPGSHGFHIHEKGACSPDFKAAGGHFNPAGKGHGINHPKGSHGGDMLNIYAAADGSVKAEVLNVKVTLSSGDNSVFDSDGSAIVIHAKPDTYGAKAGAGARIACGVIKK